MDLAIYPNNFLSKTYEPKIKREMPGNNEFFSAIIQTGI